MEKYASNVLPVVNNVYNGSLLLLRVFNIYLIVCQPAERSTVKKYPQQ